MLINKMVHPNCTACLWVHFHSFIVLLAGTPLASKSRVYELTEMIIHKASIWGNL